MEPAGRFKSRSAVVGTSKSSVKVGRLKKVNINILFLTHKMKLKVTY
jgi:hypothetical protein